MWLAERGPSPHLNLMPLAFILHMLADGYAVFATDIFEYNPRRVVDETDTPPDDGGASAGGHRGVRRR